MEYEIARLVTRWRAMINSITAAECTDYFSNNILAVEEAPWRKFFFFIQPGLPAVEGTKASSVLLGPKHVFAMIHPAALNVERTL